MCITESLGCVSEAHTLLINLKKKEHCFRKTGNWIQINFKGPEVKVIATDNNKLSSLWPTYNYLKSSVFTSMSSCSYRCRTVTNNRQLRHCMHPHLDSLWLHSFRCPWRFAGKQSNSSVTSASLKQQTGHFLLLVGAKLQRLHEEEAWTFVVKMGIPVSEERKQLLPSEK